MGESGGQRRGLRWLDWTSLAGFAVLLAALAWRIAPFADRDALLLAGALLAGWLASDFTSGLFHWLADTWGSPTTPLVGRALIRPFREHHRDPEAIADHDFAETNGSSALISLPVLFAAHALPLEAGAAALFGAAFLGALVSWTLATNQFHQWAHTARPPALAGALQRLRIALPPVHHARHHAAPHTTHYCITSGLLNPLLQRLRLFSRLEAVVVRLTGATPRAGAADPSDAGAQSRGAKLAIQVQAGAPSTQQAASRTAMSRRPIIARISRT
jgi:ubiquitin-conjugating enzyme E2 variant